MRCSLPVIVILAFLASLLVTENAQASFQKASAKSTTLVTLGKTENRSANRTAKKLQKEKPVQPKKLVSPWASPILTSGIISADGSVKPIGSTPPITRDGILSISEAAPAIYLPAVNPAARDAEIAQLELVQYLYYDYPTQLRLLDSQITVTQAEIVALHERLANYSRFDKFINNANPLFESRQLVSVALVDAQQRLANLQYERGRIQQWLPVEIRRRQLGLDRALQPAFLVPGAAAPLQGPGYNATFDDDKNR